MVVNHFQFIFIAMRYALSFGLFLKLWVVCDALSSERWEIRAQQQHETMINNFARDGCEMKSRTRSRAEKKVFCSWSRIKLYKTRLFFESIEAWDARAQLQMHRDSINNIFCHLSTWISRVGAVCRNVWRKSRSFSLIPCLRASETSNEFRSSMGWCFNEVVRFSTA